jgi:hypothetical protein
MNQSMATHRTDDHRVGKLFAEQRNRRIDLRSDDTTHAMRRENVVAEGAPVLAPSPLIPITMRDEYIDALRQSSFSLLLKQTDIDDLQVLVDTLPRNLEGMSAGFLRHLGTGGSDQQSSCRRGGRPATYNFKKLST